jgi:hypothetical protein
VLGPVFRTHDPDHERVVAVKAFSLDLTPEQSVGLSEQFQRLVDLGIEHQYIAAPVAAGVEDFVAYLAVPYVAGESLDTAIRQYGPAPAVDAIRLVAHVAEALDAAAMLGVFHGSLHPRDVLVTPGETHVTGLGIAQALERIGLHGPIRRPYVAPERESGDEWGAAADICSLAAIAYEVLTGRRALPGTDQPLAALSELRVHNAAAVKDVIETALDPDPERRPARAQDFATAFAAALSETAGSVTPGGRGTGHRPRKARVRPPKLPGLDEPLLPAELARPPVAPVIAAVVATAVLPESAPDALAVEESAPAVGPDVPTPVAPEIEAAVVPVVEPEVAAAAAQEEISVPREVRPVDERTPGESGGEQQDIPEPAQGVNTPAEAEPDFLVDFDPDSRTALELPDELEGVVELVPLDRATDSAFPVEDARSFQLAGFDEAEPSASKQDQSAVELEAFEFSFPPVGPKPPGTPGVTPSVEDLEQEAETVRPSRRRRTPRTVTPAPEPADASPPRSEPPVPRALDSGRGYSASRPSVPLGSMPPAPSDRPSRLPIAAGVAAGLVLGLAIGYYLGSRPSVSTPVPGVALTTAARTPSSQPAPAAPQTPEIREPAAAAAVPSASVAGTPAQASATPARATASEPAPTPRAAVAAPARPGRAPRATRGEILVRATPVSGNVFIDGERQGLTPRNVRSLPFGSHTVRVTRPLYAPRERVVTLSAEHASVLVEFTLHPEKASPAGTAAGGPAARTTPTARPPVPPTAAGAPRSPPTPVIVVPSLSIETRPPGARVRVDGRDVGVTPLTVTPLGPGSHSVELQLSGYRLWSSTLTLAAGQRRRLTASLERERPR